MWVVEKAVADVVTTPVRLESDPPMSDVHCYRCGVSVSPRGECGCRDKCCLICADCREVLPLLEAGSVDLVLTDPEYEIVAAGAGMGARRKYLADINGHLDGGFDPAILSGFRNWFVFCGKDQLVDVISAASSNGRWMLLTWNKPNPTPLVNANYLPDTEYIVHSFQPCRLFGEYADKSRFIVHPVVKNGFNHPTVKPLFVIRKLLTLGTEEGDLVLDPFLGSGTTLRACKDLGRRGIGCEIEEKYCEIAARRLEQEVLF